ncbi:Anthocyanidin 3-O-glucosyltransferase [Glycine soja]|uniref:Glycosyltransferase n=1 Tax=Glycine soja TaxID=3848 RepID=A0A0B2RAV4_GLYSO|nr:Anthocyanidin 3-O-glucosyltransferase [Glycine soja]
MFPFLAFGHISPFVQLSNKLFSHGVHVTFLSAASNIPRIRSTLNLNPAINVISLKFPNGITNTAELPPHLAGNLIHALDLTQDQVKSLLLELKPHYVFFDFAQHWLPKLASEVGIKSVHFSVYSAISDAYITVPSRFADVEGRNITFEDLKKPPPGYPQNSNISLKAFEAMDFMFLFTRFGEKNLTGYERVLQSLGECSFIVFKTCKEIEGPYLDYIETQFRKPVLLSGPLVPEPSTDVLEEKWSKWLDGFPAKSVILCSFGSETFLSDYQIKELASGLELTGLPFILVLAKAELERALPKGYLERVKNRGVVHSGWFQQQLVLKHSSVGCYVCHGGFSSVIEAMVNECQLVLLPFKGDQFFNSKLIANDLKAGVEVNRSDEDGFFHKEDILEALKTVMLEDNKEQGKQIRENHMQWSKFLSNKEIQNKFITDLVAQLKSMA